MVHYIARLFAVAWILLTISHVTSTTTGVQGSLLPTNQHNCVTTCIWDGLYFVNEDVGGALSQTAASAIPRLPPGLLLRHGLTHVVMPISWQRSI
jgi:hypothetical protein